MACTRVSPVLLAFTLLATPFMMGQEGCLPPADFDGEGPFVQEYSNSGCTRGQEYGPILGLFGCGPDQVEIIVEGNSIDIVHRQATYNCCPDDIVVTLAVEGATLRVSEQEVLTAPCRCMCCYDVDSTIANLEPGTYTVEYCWIDYAMGETCDTEEVTIAGD